METWKDITGFEGLYQVSDMGHFRSLDCIRPMKNGVIRQYYGRDLSTKECKDGYLYVDLTDKDGKRKSYKAHRIVAEHFVRNPLNLPVVNHRNENKHDNRSSNLEWCSVKYNLNYGTTQRRRAEKISWKVRQFDADYNYIRTFVTMSKAAEILRFPKVGIYKAILSGRKYRGYFFRKCN